MLETHPRSCAAGCKGRRLVTAPPKRAEESRDERDEQRRAEAAQQSKQGKVRPSPTPAALSRCLLVHFQASASTISNTRARVLGRGAFLSRCSILHRDASSSTSSGPSLLISPLVASIILCYLPYLTHTHPISYSPPCLALPGLLLLGSIALPPIHPPTKICLPSLLLDGLFRCSHAYFGFQGSGTSVRQKTQHYTKKKSISKLGTYTKQSSNVEPLVALCRRAPCSKLLAPSSPPRLPHCQISVRVKERYPCRQ